MTIWFPASATSKSEIPQDKRAEKVCSYLADFWFIPTHAGNTTEDAEGNPLTAFSVPLERN